MTLSDAETEELASLTAALTKARTGQMVSKFVFNGQETDFSKVDLADLKTRVGELNAKAASPTGRMHGPIRFNFGR